MEAIKLDPFTRLLSINFPDGAAWLVAYTQIGTGNNANPPAGSMSVSFRVQSGQPMVGGTLPTGVGNNHKITAGDLAKQHFAVQASFFGFPGFSDNLQSVFLSKIPTKIPFGVAGTLSLAASGLNTTTHGIIGVIPPGLLKAGATITFKNNVIGFPDALPIFGSRTAPNATPSTPSSLTFQLRPDYSFV